MFFEINFLHSSIIEWNHVTTMYEMCKYVNPIDMRRVVKINRKRR